MNKTRLSQFLNTGEAELVTEDPDVIRRAHAARINPGTIETFVYFDGEEDAKITGRVTSTRPDEEPFRFAVMAAEEP